MAIAYYEREMMPRRGNSWSQISFWLTAWAALGGICGAAFGAATGARLMAEDGEAGALAMVGSTLGFAVGVGLWFARQRLRGKMAADETEP